MTDHTTTAQALLLHLRQRRGWSQTQLGLAIGDALGLPTGAGPKGQAVSQWERGTTTPSRANVIAADQVLDAGGQLAAAYGHRLTTGDDHIQGMLGRLEALAARQAEAIERLQQRVDALEQRPGRNNRRAPAGGTRTPPPAPRVS